MYLHISAYFCIILQILYTDTSVLRLFPVLAETGRKFMSSSIMTQLHEPTAYFLQEVWQALIQMLEFVQLCPPTDSSAPQQRDIEHMTSSTRTNSVRHIHKGSQLFRVDETAGVPLHRCQVPRVSPWLHHRSGRSPALWLSASATTARRHMKSKTALPCLLNMR